MLRGASWKLVGRLQRYFATKAEETISALISRHLQGSVVRVEDTSGGCGTMFSIEVESSDFRGLSTVAQHRRVKEILKDEIPKWHGFVLNTRKPPVTS